MELDLILIFGSEGGKCVCVCGTRARKGRRGLHSNDTFPLFMFSILITLVFAQLKERKAP